MQGVDLQTRNYEHANNFGSWGLSNVHFFCFKNIYNETLPGSKFLIWPHNLYKITHTYKILRPEFDIDDFFELGDYKIL